jgi:class 3 adenylate cyclase
MIPHDMARPESGLLLVQASSYRDMNLAIDADRNSFDLWGDTVNTAARMESNGVPGHITLSEDAWEQIAHQSRGEPLKRDIKGNGNLRLMRFDGWLP